MTAALAWTSVGIATGYRGNTRVSTARAMAHGASTACHGCGLGTCRGSVRGKLRVTNHGNPRKSAAIATAISADAEPQQFSRPSAAIATAILRYAAITTEDCGNCHGIFRGSQTIAISTAIRGNPPIHGNCHESPGNCHSKFHGIPRPSTAIELQR